jgi:hypothetical protein
MDQADGARAIEVFLHGDPIPEIFADWPEDVRLFYQALMIEPGRTAQIDRLRFEIHRVEPYPTELVGRLNTMPGGTRWRCARGSSTKRSLSVIAHSRARAAERPLPRFNREQPRWPGQV